MRRHGADGLVVVGQVLSSNSSFDICIERSLSSAAASTKLPKS